MVLIAGETKQRNFEEQLKYGKDWEDRFAKWLISQGYFVTPKYLFAEEGAPLLIGQESSYAIPDIDAARCGKRIWFECKRKTIFDLHPCTGFSNKAYTSYKKVQEITGDKVFVIFEDLGRDEKSSNRINGWNYYGNYINEMDKFIYRENWIYEKTMNITYKYPEAFVKIELI